MISPAVTVRQAEPRLELLPVEACRRLRAGQCCTLLIDGAGGFAESWLSGPLLAVEPSIRWCGGAIADGAAGLEALERLVASRRAAGGTADTGVAALLSYHALACRGSAAGPDLLVLEVDRSLRFDPAGRVRFTERGPGRAAPGGELPSRLHAAVAPRTAARGVDLPRTSLPRERYLEAVERIRRHIADGDIYQANLCQRFDVTFEGDPFELYARLAADGGAPQSAFIETPDLAVASMSPESFLRLTPPDRVETWPIKGTRPRAADPLADRAAARELQDSPKDRAELLMIVDLERNDLSRVCRPGTVCVSDLARLRSYRSVHHLVAGVHGRLKPGVGPSTLIRATFPGGSITGAPKIRAMEILSEIEPVPRGWFTGSLFWFGDDGHMDSSILIRTWQFRGDRAWLGAGGGIVADSDPELEWRESNHKARALARAIGFDPEEAA